MVVAADESVAAEEDGALLVSAPEVVGTVELLAAALVDCPARADVVREELLVVGAAAEGTLDAVVPPLAPALSVSAAAVTPDPVFVETRRGSGT